MTTSSPTTTLTTAPAPTTTLGGALPTITIPNLTLQTAVIQTLPPTSVPEPPDYLVVSEFNDFCEPFQLELEYDTDDPTVVGFYYYADAVSNSDGILLETFEGTSDDRPDLFPVTGIFCLDGWWTDAIHYVELWAYNFAGIYSDVPATVEWYS